MNASTKTGAPPESSPSAGAKGGRPEFNAGEVIAAYGAGRPHELRPDQIAGFNRAVGDPGAAQQIMKIWRALCATLRNWPDNAFEQTHKPAAFRRRLQDAAKHAEALAPLLDRQTADWILMAALGAPELMPFDQLQAQFDRCRAEVGRLSNTLRRLLLDLRAAEVSVTVRRGAPVQFSLRNVATWWLIDRLKRAGVKWSIAERSRMVAAVRVCWEVAGFEGDPREFMRGMKEGVKSINPPSLHHSP